MTTLHSDVEVIVSTTSDGSLRSSLQPYPQIDDAATQRFFQRHDINSDQAVLLRLSYDTDDFCKYHEVTTDEIGAGFAQPQLAIADGIVTRQAGVTMFLPIADCIGAVLYHPPTRTLMLSHLGRHNLEQQGGEKSVEYLTKFGVKPDELLVYLSPAASKEHYPLYAFDNKSLHDVAVEQLIGSSVPSSNITVDSRDTVTDPDFYSHSAALRGEKPRGRHAIVCYIRA
ncbi:MAG: hypothetical protein UY35_C0031G0008 [Candidatus Saccharibacteria bacterium GW2011_GWC2_48_9]|nr:MAG: hypothetical protein UY35_C0031G0008 [Candidatus Saccharibacteria bacterium GW2011_GWC2_48_9]